MCGRFAAGHLTQRELQDIVEGFLDGPVGIDPAAPQAPGGYHVRPTHRVNLIVQDGPVPVLTTANWQIAPKGGRPLINARIENDSYWQGAWAERRCMIPALGYFEWTKESGRKAPVFITVKRNAQVVFFAGFRSEDGQGCVILTREPSAQIAHIHSRMPVILSGPEMKGWLTGQIDVATAQEGLGTTWDGRFEYHAVAPLTADAQGEAVIEPYTPSQRSFEF